MKRLLAILLVLLMVNPAGATVFYVDSAVTDTNVGSATCDFTTYNPATFATDTGSDCVYKTVADVNAKSPGAGNSVLFRKGQSWTVTGTGLTVPQSGTNGNPITYGAYGAGNLPIITAVGALSGWNVEDNWTSVDTTITYQHDGSTTAYNTYDTYLYQLNPTTNYGTAGQSFIGAASGPTKEYTSVVAFPNIIGTGIGQIPSGTTITSATLTLVLSAGARGSGLTIGAYTINRDWVPATNETTATWNTYDGTNAWTAAGGDYDASAVASHVLAAQDENPITFDLTTSLQAMLDGSHSNYGWLFRWVGTLDAWPYWSFITKEGTAANRPKLAVIYSSNAWTIAYAHDPIRLWIDGTEYLRATTNAVDATKRWYYDSAGSKIYLYSTSNPATNYSSITVAVPTSGENYTVDLEGKDYITLDSLDLRGGDSSVKLNASSYFTLTNSKIGMNGNYGLKTYAGTTASCDYGNIHDNVFDAGYSFTYAGIEAPGPHDAILLQRGAKHWTIYNNTIYNWGHSGFNIYQAVTQNTIDDILFYSNDVSGANVSYMRGFVVQSMPASLTNVSIYKNYFHDLKVRNQLNCSNVSVYNNLFTRVRETAAKATEEAQGIRIESYDEDGVHYNATNNLIYNNTFYDIDSLCLEFTTADSDNSTGNIVKNNIFAQCGQSSASYANQAMRVQNETHVNTNTISNNIFYVSGGSTVMNYRGTAYTVANWQGALSQSDVAANNLQLDPTITSATDFRLNPKSPAIGAGANVSLSTDIAGRAFRGIPSMGAYEYIPKTHCSRGRCVAMGGK